MMKLIGSTTSPFVRKVRLLLESEGLDYEFETLKALSPEGARALSAYGPIKRIPILLSEGKTIFDSTIIMEYLLEKQGRSLSVDDKLTLRMIDELCDSCVILFQQRVWKIDENWENELSQRMLDRSLGILDHLDQSIDRLNEFQRDWLYCVLDWLSFRSVLEWQKDRARLTAFYNSAASLEKYRSTSLVG